MNRPKKNKGKTKKESQLDLFTPPENYTPKSNEPVISNDSITKVISFEHYKDKLLIKRFYEEAEKYTRHLD